MKRHALWKPSLLIALILSLSTGLASAQGKKSAKRAPANRNRPQPSKTEADKAVGGVQLKMNLYNPKGHKPGDKLPAVVFFFGGG